MFIVTLKCGPTLHVVGSSVAVTGLHFFALPCRELERESSTFAGRFYLASSWTAEEVLEFKPGDLGHK